MDSGSCELRKIKMEDDNCCLFNAFDYCLSAGCHTSNKDSVQSRRKAIAGEILRKPDKYTEAFLGLNPEEYCRKITMPNTWGGAIELDILSDLMHVQICVLDIRANQSYLFGENFIDTSRIYLLYDGCHYDAVVRIDSDIVITMFPSTDDKIYQAALLLMSQEKKAGNFTDVANFTLKCDQCGQRLQGQIAAEQHAKQFGHVDFSEIKHNL
ncbi:hypothetical protein GJ496_006838 [Pomphorhynchus laevis]|nr:hypothetical protein GJ496_006838 [Pomphorhynchus laevis]